MSILEESIQTTNDCPYWVMVMPKKGKTLPKKYEMSGRWATAQEAYDAFHAFLEKHELTRPEATSTLRSPTIFKGGNAPLGHTVVYYRAVMPSGKYTNFSIDMGIPYYEN